MTPFESPARQTMTRQRPSVHFTATDGWVNDPCSVTWNGSQYHLFYQTLPGRVIWAPDCRWGHCVSPDLVHWREKPLALSPAPYETGCWSGSYLAAGEDGAPTILYTRVVGDSWNIGQVAIAHGSADSTVWTTSASDVVIPAPPDQLRVSAFRDPYVWKDDDSWKMIIGAELSAGTAAALQYSSADLRHWNYDGVLCSRPGTETQGTWTGTLWECPQFFALGNDWILLVSVWNDDNLHYVAAAVGGYDGAVFHPRGWEQLTYGLSAYAMSTFIDADGRRCAMSWLREEPQNNPELLGFAGAHSVAATVNLLEGRLVLRPHPSVVAALPSISTKPGRQTLLDSSDAHIISVDRDTQHVVFTDDAGERCRVTRNVESITVCRDGRADESMPSTTTDLRLLLDADIVEIFGSHYGAYRLRPALGEQRATSVGR